MHKKTLFVMTGAILVVAVVTVAICNVNVANAQKTNVTAGGGNMTKTMNMTAGGGNMTKTMNSTHRRGYSTCPGYKYKFSMCFNALSLLQLIGA